ncbi:unnamed protein product [Cuscuta campestris]|uniref:Uncharacterized protein n=1 Tax=Cuscuta campestris TaxID=132261 RepID=A0A484KBC0_9ASTE|nr:unnamed protein product [Cuscuta campestris]
MDGTDDEMGFSSAPSTPDSYESELEYVFDEIRIEKQMEMVKERLAAYYKPKEDEPKEVKKKEDEDDDDTQSESYKYEEGMMFCGNILSQIQSDATKTSRGVFLSSYVGVIFQLCVSLCALVYFQTLTGKLMMTICTEFCHMTICLSGVCNLLMVSFVMFLSVLWNPNLYS